MSAAPSSQPTYIPSKGALFGHPTGLFALFFAEMWERFSYYGMRSLLVFYMMKGFLSYGDADAYRVYGAYTALVYMTPFFGGMIADRLIGARRSVIFGGLLMALGHLTMTIESAFPFYLALGLLIVGNGFFKPNISTIVGSLYPPNSVDRDGGFTIFYMGINLGAAMAPLLCGYIGETYGWHYGFGIATIGMLIGLAVFIVPNAIARGLILTGAVLTAFGMIALQDNFLLLLVNGFVALALLVSGVISFVALGRAGLPPGAGAPPDPVYLSQRVGPIALEWLVYTVVLLGIPVAAGLVYWGQTIIPASLVASIAEVSPLLGTLVDQISKPAGLVLFLTGVAALVYIGWAAMQSTRVEAQRLFVVVTLMFFSMLFWAFFEQAGSSINNFTDRNIDRVSEIRVLTQADVGTTLDVHLTQEQIGYSNGSLLYTLDVLDEARKTDETTGENKLDVKWEVDAQDVGMGIAASEIPASTFQSANPIFIILFGLLFSIGWTALGKRGLEPNTPVKFSLGLLQLALGFVVLWYGAKMADDRGMVGMSWLILAYLLHTTGELCLSPVGLSMVTKLSPARLGSTVMGAWFLATAFSSYLSSIIAVFTGVTEGEEGSGAVPLPIETLHDYSSVFGTIGVAALLSSVLLLVLSPLLAKWMHSGVK